MYFRTLVRYVEANPLKPKFVALAQKWQWSSLGCNQELRNKLVDPWPVERPRNWTAIVNQPMRETEIARVQGELQARQRTWR